MVTRIGINGFGRIGRQVLRAAIERYSDKLEIVGVNTPASTEINAHIFKYDSSYGIYPGEVGLYDNGIVVDGKEVRFLSESNPKDIPWGDLGVDIVIESTGKFTDASKAHGHIESGSKKVIISAPAKGEDIMVVLGVNENGYDPNKHHVLSNASCTTNCIAPMVSVLHQNFGVKRGLMSTVHAYTNDQRILDGSHNDLRRARSAAQNIIPTTTGAARSVGVILPELEGKIHGVALRVPVPTGSITDFVAELNKNVTVDDINRAFRDAAEGPLRGILEYTEDPIVSHDIVANTHSCIFDSLSTIVMEGNMVKILGWYDNEWGYSCRTIDLCSFLIDKGL